MKSTKEHRNLGIKHVTGVTLIDRQHDILIGKLNNLHVASLCARRDPDAQFLRNTRRVINNHIHHHLFTENKMMLLMNYPEYNQHKHEHRDIWERIQERSKSVHESDSLQQIYFLNFIKEEILSHITDFDKELAEFILRKRYHAKLEHTMTKRLEYLLYFGQNTV